MALNRSEIVDLYRRRSKRYNFSANLYYLIGFREWAYRKKAITVLDLQPGDTVVEICCGTGLNFSLLEQAVGPEGKIIGVDLTDHMLSEAQKRVDQNGWSNVELVHCDAASYQFPKEIGGILSTFALTLVPEFDDVIRRGALALSPGKRWVVSDLRLPSGKASWITPLLLPLFRPFGVTLDLADRHPWESIEQHLESAHVDFGYFGFVYIASGKTENVEPATPDLN